MTEKETDRRVQRTRTLLKSALMRLINEKGYDAVTIQDIAERANLGRTTFYLHYQSKEALLLDHHAEALDILALRAWSREELLAQKEASGLVEFLRNIVANRGVYLAIATARDAEIILKGMQEQMVRNLSESIMVALPDQEPRIPLVVLCNYVVGAQLALIKWWMMTRTDYQAIQIAHMIQRLQYAAIRDAYQLG